MIWLVRRKRVWGNICLDKDLCAMLGERNIVQLQFLAYKAFGDWVRGYDSHRAKLHLSEDNNNLFTIKHNLIDSHAILDFMVRVIQRSIHFEIGPAKNLL